MVKNVQGAAKGTEENDLLVACSLMAVQPAGELFHVNVRPHSAQNKAHPTYHSDTEKLVAALKEKLKNHLPTLRQVEEQAHASRPAGIRLKVLFVFGKNASEKDLDNMLKWFLDAWKDAAEVDDSLILDLRALKYRLSTDDEGFLRSVWQP